ncbi:hypothetical protein DPMN_185293 [Dreissena polymorpha]|uniref:Uncharacterized protein n=1 Tax=Dreissena polymorpha TaxID=45954 RepID=A0A9D4I8L3_DREPO|nr:hypothetical protein DPMN_185293 [Dreissena polymorpha]
MESTRSRMAVGRTLSAAHFSNSCCGNRSGSGFRDVWSSCKEARYWLKTEQGP